MGAIILRSVVKEFGDVRAVDGISLEIADGEIVCFLGPSGCGKTTTLRMIAGFERPTAGEIYIGDQLVSSEKHLVPPERRNLGMVFQNYAVWPHMTVFDNVAYPLKLRKVPKPKLREKVMETLEMVGLTGLEKRYPEQLSGGQQQRVALARALVVEPVAMLLDEPLSNLDAKLREKMRFEIMDLHRRTKITVIYVTHDQAEAMVLSDRIVVMHKGRIVQIGDPVRIYREPVNAFVADFIGLANFAPARLVELREGRGIAELTVGKGLRFPCRVPLAQRGGTVEGEGLLFVRPEDIELVPEGEAELIGMVARRTFLGDRLDLRVEAEGMEWRVETNPDIQFDEGTRVGLLVKRAVFLTGEEGHEPTAD
jgi:iron(III) transport system ATP-binding protein